MVTPGQAAFEKWASLLDVSYPVTWQTMPERSKAAWEDIAQAAIDQDVINIGDNVVPRSNNAET